MQAKKYKIEVYRSTLHFTHGFRTTIDEVYIEDRQIYLNFAGETANVFKGDDKRFLKGKEVEAIEISDRVVRDLERFVKQREKINKIVRALFSPKTPWQVVREKRRVNKPDSNFS